MCGFHFFLIYICGKRNDCSLSGVRLDGFPSAGKSKVRGLPHTKHKHEPPDGPRSKHKPEKAEEVGW